MLKHVLIAVTAACLATIAFATPPTVKQDRFEAKTSVESKLLLDPRHLFMIDADVKEHQLTELSMWLVWYGTEWKYLGCHEIHFLVDDKPFPVESKFHNSMEKTITIEAEIVTLSREQLGKLAAASKIEVKVCNDEGVLPDAFLQNIKDFVPVLDEQLAAVPAEPAEHAKPL